MSWWW